MFASLHLEENELKKLWVEFGKIDTDNGGTVSTQCGVFAASCRMLDHGEHRMEIQVLQYKQGFVFLVWYDDSNGATRLK